MSSKCKFLAIALVFFTILGLWAATSKADVTGSFTIHISFNPIQCQDLDLFGFTYIDQPCEKTLMKIDFQTGLDINIAISGLLMGLHSHAGVTGFEDILLHFATTLGALEIDDWFVFSQAFGVVEALDGEDIPTCYASDEDFNSCLTLFVKKRVEATISLGGVTFDNLAIFEDVNFPNYCTNPATVFVFGRAFCTPKGKQEGGIYTTDDQAFGFGDVVTLEGQTPSGITVTSETGICAQQTQDVIKKHDWPFEVNPDCVSGARTARKTEVEEFTVSPDGVPPFVTIPVPPAVAPMATVVCPLLPVPALALADVATVVISGNISYIVNEVKCVIDNNGDGFLSAGDQIVKKIVNVTNNSDIDIKFLGKTNVFTAFTPAGPVVLGVLLPPPPDRPTEDCQVKIAPGFTTTFFPSDCRSTSAPIPAGTTSIQIEETVEALKDVLKPALFFDFEKLFITGIPLASGLTLDLAIECIMPGGPTCGFFQTWTITGGPIFNLISVDTGFEGLPLGATGTSFSEITVLATGGPLTLLMTIDPADFTVSFWRATLSVTINPDTNPASLRLRAQGVPGLSFLEAVLTVRRAGLTFSADLDFDASPTGTFNFDDLTLAVSAEAGIVTISADILIDEHGTDPEEAFLLGGNVNFTVNF